MTDRRALAANTNGPVRPFGVAEDAIVRVLRVPPESAGMRLDRFIASQLRSTSRTRARAIVRASAYAWDGRPMRPSERVRAETHVVLWREGLEEEPPPCALTVLYADPHLLVVDKPTLMTVHPTARHHNQTVIKQLEFSRPGEYLSLVHRLDRDTSGILLVSRSQEADRAFKMGLEARSIAAARAAEADEPALRSDKTYLAITRGVPPNGLINAPLMEDPSPLRVKMRQAPAKTGLAARTGVLVLATASGYALVRCDLYTGRQHQIRVHLSHLGTPVVGDKLYGQDERLLARSADGELTDLDLALLELPRHALHAYQHRLVHPFTGEEHEFTAPLPADLREFWLSKGGLLPTCT